MICAGDQVARDYLMGMEHFSVAVGTPQQVLFLYCVRIVDRDVVHVGAVPLDLSRYSTDISPNQPGDLPIT